MALFEMTLRVLNADCIVPITFVKMNEISVYDDAHRAPIEGAESDTSSDAPMEPPSPGPLDPEHCTVTGQGFSGGGAGILLPLTVTSKDSRGLRIREGGHQVVVVLRRSEDDVEVTRVEAKDNQDGTYIATYKAPPRGDYKLSITMNDVPIGGSPFPVFFSPPTMAELAASLLYGQRSSSSSSDPNSSTNEKQNDPVKVLGEKIDNCLCVGNVSSSITVDQIKQLFQYCGKVLNVNFITDSKTTALIEFSSPLEAGCAAGLNGVMVGDRPLTVKLAKLVFEGKEETPVESLAAAQHYDNLSTANQNAQQLVSQLASLRAIARTALLPAIQEEERRQEGGQAALTAAADISRKLGFKQSSQMLLPETSTKVPEGGGEQKPRIDKQKLGGPRHYNGRGRYARVRVRSRSRSGSPRRHRHRKSEKHRRRDRKSEKRRSRNESSSRRSERRRRRRHSSRHGKESSEESRSDRECADRS